MSSLQTGTLSRTGCRWRALDRFLAEVIAHQTVELYRSLGTLTDRP
jgi:hypothetical protein